MNPVAGAWRPVDRRVRVIDEQFATLDPSEPKAMQRLRWAYWYLKPQRGDRGATDDDLSYVALGMRRPSAVFALDDQRRVRCRIRDCLWRAIWEDAIGNENGLFGRIMDHLARDHGETHEAYQTRHRRARIAVMKEIAMSFVCNSVRLVYHDDHEIDFAAPLRFEALTAHRLGGCGAIARAIDRQQQELWRSRLRGEPDFTEDTLDIVFERFNNAEFAIKKLDISRNAPDLLKRTCREVALALTLSHPNVISAVDLYFDISQQQMAAATERAFALNSAEPINDLVNRFTSVYLVMPFHPTCLQEHLNEVGFRNANGVDVQYYAQLLKPAPRGTRKRYLYDILCGVAYLHRRNVAHRDLNPKNILLVNSFNDSRMAVCDYSSAKTPDAHATEVYHCTKYYNAPETCPLRVIGRPLMPPPTNHDGVHREDMWAIGCIAAEMILGRPLFAEVGECQKSTELERIFRRCGCGTLDPAEIQEAMTNLGKARRVYTELGMQRGPEARAAELQRTIQQFTDGWNAAVAACNEAGKPMQPNQLLVYMEPHIEYLVSQGALPPSSDELDLVSQLLSIDPLKRPTCEEAYQHPFFKNDPTYHTEDPTTHTLLPPRNDVRDADVELNIRPDLTARDARALLWDLYVRRHPKMVDLIDCCCGRYGFRTVLVPADE